MAHAASVRLKWLRDCTVRKVDRMIPKDFREELLEPWRTFHKKLLLYGGFWLAGAGLAWMAWVTLT
jgi:hypothetical protein